MPECSTIAGATAYMPKCYANVDWGNALRQKNFLHNALC